MLEAQEILEKEEQGIDLLAPLTDGRLELATAASTAADRPIRTGEVSSQRSQLFMVRLWPEELGGGQVEWRGQVYHVLSREAYAFCNWSRLTTCLQRMLQGEGCSRFGVG